MADKLALFHKDLAYCVMLKCGTKIRRGSLANYGVPTAASMMIEESMYICRCVQYKICSMCNIF